MLSQPELILLTGVVRLFVGFYSLFAAVKTWNNPHLEGREISPKFILAFACLEINDGLRAVSFYIDPVSDGVYLSLWITLLLCIWVLHRTRKVTKTITYRLK